MAGTERPVYTAVIEPQRPLGALPNGGHTHDKEVVVEEDKVLLPAITARIKEAVRAPADSLRDLLSFRHIAERARPGQVIEVIGATSGQVRRDLWQPTTQVVFPTGGWNDVVYVELSSRRHQTVFTCIARSRP